MADRPMPLALLLTSTGTHVASWRHPEAPTDRTTDFTWFAQVAQAAEASRYDLLFIADSLYVNHRGRGVDRRHPRHAHLEFEPLTLLSALSVVTRHIGLAATVSTTYSMPYTVARAFASLDHLSGGRAGWNVVTSQSDMEARNYGLDLHAQHAERYARAADFVDAVTKLWDSWEEEALVADRRGGQAMDPARLHRIEHHGPFFAVEGPLNVRRPPQGHPVVIQAGSSGPGQDLAAATADIVFTAQENKAQAQAFYRSVKDRALALGRVADSLIVMPGVFAIVGETEAEAQAKFAALQDLIDPVVGVSLLGNLLGDIDLDNIDVDGPMPLPTDTNASKSRIEAMRRMGLGDGCSVREAYTRLAPARGHLTLIGAAEQVADTLCDWHAGQAGDGFMLVPGVMPQAQSDFDRLVLPILRDRGLARKAYEADTLRGNLGLPVPRNSLHAATGR